MGDNEQTDSPSINGVTLNQIPLHSTNLLTVLDETGIIQYESPSIKQLYGYDQEALVGDPVIEYVHPDDRKRVQTAFEDVVTSDAYTVQAVEYRHRQADGTYRWVESVASANPTPDGQYVANTRDISERKEREQQLQATNERLNSFASVVSHDLRNPLNVAQLRLQLVQQEVDNQHLAVIENSHTRMEELIEELLALAQTGGEEFVTESVSLPAVVKQCWQTVDTAEATLCVETDQSVLADASQLQQLFENLIRNAIEHGGDDVTVTVGATETGFYIEDTGPGIPPERQQDVFETGTTTNEDGTGLGLSIVEQIVEMHGWEVALSNGEAGGARVEFTDV